MLLFLFLFRRHRHVYERAALQELTIQDHATENLKKLKSHTFKSIKNVIKKVIQMDM